MQVDDSLPLSIFTPTFNRKRLLSRLYNSLLLQTNYSFEWLIVDDGSDDGTDALVNSWISDNLPFMLRYIRQENSGKHVAHNRGAIEAAGKFFMCVDSDDWLEPNAVAIVLKDSKLCKKEEGIIYPRLFAQGSQTGQWFPTGIKFIELADMRMKYGFVIETAIVFRTSILRSHPFPVIDGERYMPEGSAYFDFKTPECFLTQNTAFYRCEYLDDGLTKNIYKNWFNNPKGVVLALNKRFEAACHYGGLRAFRERIAAIVGIESLNMAHCIKAENGLSCNKIISTVLMPLAFLYRNRRYGKAS